VILGSLTSLGRGADNSVMTDHALKGWAPRVLRALVAVVLGVAAGTGGVLLAIISFEWTVWAPAVVSLGLIVLGAVLYRRTDDLIGRGVAIGLILGGALTVPLWSFFPIDTGGDLESLGF
jgi:peptidoglycan biosynthesis protein MviN/MurJ (putative lipid II flippase)